ncbi:gas vesicle protein GvpO [Micromonospora sp. CPCC 206060]|uniref:gas vesicle protein GvpO n=1 Tax=Micromonospora sp. CPCC 206060 TaxID=3122406 RepID=UPI002FF122DC
MDVLWALLTLPYAPVRGLTAVVRTLHRQADAQLFDPANVRRELEELDRDVAAGRISREERGRAQQAVLDRLVAPGPTGPVTPTTGDAVPATTEELVPAATGDAVPATTGDLVPAATGDAVPVTTGDPVPRLWVGPHRSGEELGAVSHEHTDDEPGYTDDESEYDDEPAGLAAAQVPREAMRQIAELTGKQTLGAISLEPTDEGWLVGVETIEDQRLPSSIDLLGLYLVELDGYGELLAYRRVRRYPRGKSEVG